MNEPQGQTRRGNRLSLWDRCKVVGIAFAFWFMFTAIFAVIVAFAEPLSDLRQYPLDPQGWFVVRLADGSVVREANVWDMVKAKYAVLLFLGGYVAVILFTLYVMFLGIAGKCSRLTRWVLTELSRKSFTVTK